jgi:membrane protease YdiL (CAAX protease family)
MKDGDRLTPLPLRSAVIYFGIPAAAVIIVVYVVMPALDSLGLPIFFNYLIVYATLPMIALIAASIIAYRREGNAPTWLQFKDRFRLGKMDGKSWLWAIGLTLFMFLSAAMLSFTARWLASFEFLAPPSYWPAELQPSSQNSPGGTLPTEFMGQSLAGNWWILILLLVSLIIATFGEELWWRGYILPRQELAHGQRTWLVHGLLWCAFHLFAPWNLLTILPGCLALSYVAQRLKNTWPAIIAHGLANGLLVLVIVALGITV